MREIEDFALVVFECDNICPERADDTTLDGALRYAVDMFEVVNDRLLCKACAENERKYGGKTNA